MSFGKPGCPPLRLADIVYQDGVWIRILKHISRVDWFQKVELVENSLPASTEWFSVEIDKYSIESSSTMIVKVRHVDIEGKPGFNPELLTELVRTLKTLC